MTTSAPARRHLTLRAATVLAILAALLAWPAPAAHAAPVSACTEAGISVSSLGGPNFYIDSGSSPEFRSGFTGYQVRNESGAELRDLWVGLSDFTGGSLALAAGQSPAQRVGNLQDAAAGSRFWYLTAAAVNAAAQTHTVTVYEHNPALPNAVALCSTTDGFSSVKGTLAASANKVTGISLTGGAPTLGAKFTVTVTGDTGTIGAGSANDTESLWMSPAVVENWPADAFRLLSTSLTISPDGQAPAQTYTDILRLAGLGSTSRPYTAAYTFQAVGFTAAPTTLKPVQEISSGTQVKHTGSYAVALPAILPPVNDLTVSLSGTPDKLGPDGGVVTYTAGVSGTPGAELDEFVLNLPSGSTVIAGTSHWSGTLVADPVADDGAYRFSGPFVVAPGADLTFSVQVPGQGGTHTTSLLAVIGSSSIGATSSAVDGSDPATSGVQVDQPPVAQNSTLNTEVNTSVSVDTRTLASDPDGDDWGIGMFGGASYGMVSMTGYVLTYYPPEGWSGTDTFVYQVTDGRGGTATGTVTVNVGGSGPAQPVAQSITFAPIGDLTVGDLGSLSATASSGLPVTFTTATPEVCAVETSSSPGAVRALHAGQCTITATQPGDETHAPAAAVTRTFTAAAPAPQTQELTFTAPGIVLAGQSPVVLDVHASSGLPVTVTVVDGACTVTGTDLVAVSATACVLQATQPGNSAYEAASPVQRTVTFLAPADDTFAVPGQTSTVLDVTGNDPAGLEVATVTDPAHGRVDLAAGKVTYTPDPGYRGADEFDYTVILGGRSASAHVEVHVANLPPVVTGPDVGQRAGTVRVVTLEAADPNADPLAFAASTDNAEVSASIDLSGVLTLRASDRASGRVQVQVSVDDGAGGTARVVLTDVVTPVRVPIASRELHRKGTTIRWEPAATATPRYQVLVDGVVVCTTTATMCRLPKMIGPKKDVAIRVLGRDGTTSGFRPAGPAGHRSVLLATVYFDSDSSLLGRAGRRTLAKVLTKVRTRGFEGVSVAGYTDADGSGRYNMWLSQRRTAAVARYLDRRGRVSSFQSWHGERRPAASNSGPKGKSLNRRVEIRVQY